MSRNNLKGALERARQRWHFGAIYICRRMGRGATGALQTAGLLVEHTSRALFHRDGHLIAFPGLDLLALIAGVNEKTIRRAIDKLEESGLVRTQHRHNDSNLYYLTIPPDAEAHLFECEAAIIKRKRARRYALANCPPDMTAPKCPADRTDGNGADTKCPNSCSVTAARKRRLIRSLSRLLGFTTISLRFGFVNFRQSLVLSLSKPMQATKVRAQES